MHVTWICCSMARKSFFFLFFSRLLPKSYCLFLKKKNDSHNLRRNVRYCWKSLFGKLVWISKYVLIHRAFSRVLRFVIGFCLGYGVENVVYTWSSTAQKKGFFWAHFAKHWEIRVFMKQPKRGKSPYCRVKFTRNVALANYLLNDTVQ